MNTILRSLIPMAAAGLLVACADQGTLRVDGLLAQSEAMTAATQAGDSLELGGGLLILERARVAVSEIEFEGSGHPGEGEDEREAELGAAVVDLALDGSQTAVAASDVQAGSYHTVGLEIRVGGGSGAAFGDFGGDAPASILVDGTYDGAAFTYRSEVHPEVEFPIDPPVEVTAGGEAAVGVTFDVAAWFVDADGGVLDPTDVANRGIIEANILDSMAAFAELEDDDGDEDDD